jgi:hypothetical protein
MNRQELEPRVFSGGCKNRGQRPWAGRESTGQSERDDEAVGESSGPAQQLERVWVWLFELVFPLHSTVLRPGWGDICVV